MLVAGRGPLFIGFYGQNYTVVQRDGVYGSMLGV